MGDEKGAYNEEMSAYGLTPSITVPFENGVWVTVDSVWRKLQKRVLHKAVEKNSESGAEIGAREFVIKTQELVE